MHDWPDLVGLELLVALADHGSLSAGARAVGMAQPNASRSLARLERKLGVGLVRRSTAGSTLTPAGLLVVDWARQVLTAASTLVDGARGLHTTGRIHLRVAASQTIAEHLLPAWLARFRAMRPDLRVVLRVDNSSAVVAALLAGDTDLGFVEGPHAPRGVHTATVGRDELVLVVASAHPWSRRRRPVGRAELLATPLLTREAGSGTRIVLDTALGGAVQPLQELGSNAAVRVAVQSGVAPAVLSRLAVADGLRSGTLVEVGVEGVNLRRQLRAAWSGPRQLSGPAADLVAIASRPDRPAG